MKPPLIIGVTGELKSGKDTFFKLFSRAHYLRVVRLAFADPLKRELAYACHCTVDDIERNKDLFRGGMQWWGTEFRRQFSKNENYWIDRMRDQLEMVRRANRKGTSVVQPADVVVITDVRFPNEAEFVREEGGVLVRIVRPKGFMERVKAWFKKEHASETMMRWVKVDYTIVNGGTLAEFEQEVLRVRGEMLRNLKFYAKT